MSNHSTSPVPTPGSTRTTSGPDALRCSAKPSRTRTFFAGLGVFAVLTVATAGFSALGSGQAHADTLTTAKVRPLKVATAHPGPIETPSGKLRCTKPGQYNVTVPVRTTTAYKGTRKAALYLQYRNGEQRAVLIGRASSKAATVPVIGCLSPAQIDGHAGPIYLIAVDVIDGERNLVKVRVSR